MRLPKFKRYYNTNKVFYDPRFQRRVVWGKNEINKYIESLTLGWANTPVIVLNVQKCLEHSLDIGDQSSCEYYRGILRQGYTHISLDGQNRSKKIEAFLDNKLPIRGTFKDADGCEVFIKNETKFDNLPQRLKDHFKSGCEVSVFEHDRVTHEQAAVMFKRLNDGTPLNPQEKRQSTFTPIADVVREYSSKYKKLIDRVVDLDHQKRMLDDELVAKTLMVLMPKANLKSWDLSSNQINEFYEMGNGLLSIEDANSPYLKKDLDRAKEIMNILSATLLQQNSRKKSKLIPRKTYWATLLAAEFIHDNNYEIRNYAIFFKELDSIDAQLTVNSQSDYANARQNEINNGHDPDNISANSYYFKWGTLPHQHKSRNLRKKKLIGEISKTANLKKLTICSKKIKKTAA